MELPQPAPEVAPDRRIQRPEGLVEQQHAGLDGQRPRQRHPLPLAAGELRREAVAQPLELHRPSSRSTRARRSAVAGRRDAGITRIPKSTFCRTVMCRNSA